VKYKKALIFAGLVVVAGGGYELYQVETAPPKITYKEMKVSRGTINVTILSTGTVSPENRLQIKAPIAGRVERVLIAEGDKIKKNQVLAWMSSTERAALLDAAAARGPEELKEWEKLYQATPILAPIDGTLIQRNIDSGQTFATTDAILVMSDRLTVKAQVDETDIAHIILKQKADIILDAYPKETIPAVVDQIAYDATTTNNVTTYVVDVLPNKTPPAMRSGMTANVKFQVDSKDETLYVPTEAIKLEKGHSVVLVYDPQTQLPVSQEIKTGISDGKRTEVLSGLNEGDTFLIPQFKLENRKNGTSPFTPGGTRAPGKGH